MKKILIIHTGGFKQEGITSVILNYSRNVDRTGFQLFFLSPENVPDITKKQLEEQGKLFVVLGRKKNLRQYYTHLRKLIAEYQFDVVHIHGSSGTMAIEACAAKKAGIKKILVHGHSTKCSHPLLNKILVIFMKHFATTRIACSDNVGKWLYGKSSFLVLNNAVSVEHFLPDAQRYCDLRTRYGFQNAFVLGHVGRINNIKNHEFLLEVFEKIHIKNPQARLLFVGDGPNEEQIRQLARDKKLEDAVIFAGRQANTADYYQMMDVFVLPSKWEGFPLSLLEAQANGLTCFASSVITPKANVTGSVTFVSLEEAAESWADKIMNADTLRLPQPQIREAFHLAHLDIKEEANTLRNIYCK